MADTVRERDPLFGGAIPKMGTFPQAANTLIVGGSIVTLDSDGRADVPAAGQNAVGVARATFDNRTTAPEGGAAGAINCEVRYGLFTFGYTGTAPGATDILYVVDNQTVSTDSDSDTRGVAGYATRVDTTAGTVEVLMGPHVVGQIVEAQAAEVTNLQTDAAIGFLPIPLTSFVLAADGSPLVAFDDGVSDGFDFDEGAAYRFNPSSTAAIGTTVPLPQNLDETADVKVHVLASRVGAADTTAVVTVGAFFQAAGAAYDADADAGGNTAPALSGATKVVTETVATIAAADVQAAPCALSLTLVPSAALDADDMLVHAVWLEFSKALTS